MGILGASSVNGFIGPAGVDMRGPLLSHLVEVSGGALDAATAGTLVANLAANRNNPDELRRLLAAAFGDSHEVLADVLGRVLRSDSAGSEIAWLPLEAMINIGSNGLVTGFKGPPELDNWFQRWRAWQTAAGRQADEITPENFIRDMRLDQVVDMNADGVGIAFRNPDAQKGYRHWVLARVREASGGETPTPTLASLSDADFAANSADTYMQHVRPGQRPATAIEAMFGPSPARKAGTNAINSAPGPDKTDWGKLFRRIPGEPEADWKNRIVAMITNQAEFQQKVREAYFRRFPDSLPLPDSTDIVEWDGRIAIWVNDSVLHHVEAAGALRGELGENILLDKLLRDSLDGPEGDAVLAKLLGSKILADGINSDEFIERLIDSYLVFGAIAVKMNIPWDHAAYARLGGMFELIQKGMSRSGTIRGYAFELEVIFTSIKAHSGNADIVLQFKINNLDGPDLLLVTATRVEIKQMKAYKSISAVYHINGEAARQTGSDIRRFLEAYVDDLDALAEGTGPLDWPTIPIDGHGPRQIDNTWTYFIDGRRTPGGLSPTVATNLQNSANEMNALLRNTAQATDANVQEILSKSTEKLVKNGTETIADKLRLAMANATPPLNVAQVAILRMLMKEEMGALTDAALETLVKRARVASRLTPPVQIAFDIRTAAHLNAASHATTFAGLNTVGN